MPIMKKVREEVSLEKRLADLGVDRKSCHIDLVPENFIESPQGRLYLIDWEYSSMMIQCGIWLPSF